MADPGASRGGFDGDDPRSVVAGETPLRQLGERLRRGLPALGALMREAAELAGEAAVGTDPAGAVQVVLAPDGLPQSIQIDDRWRATVGAEGLAAAITAACRAATTAQGERIVTAMGERRWNERAAEVFGYLAGSQPPPPDLPHGPVGLGPAPEHASAAILSSTFADEAPADPDQPVLRDSAGLDRTGLGAFGRISLTFTGLSVLTCEADVDWVSGQETNDLNDALATAVAALRASVEGGKVAGR